MSPLLGAVYTQFEIDARQNKYERSHASPIDATSSSQHDSRTRHLIMFKIDHLHLSAKTCLDLCLGKYLRKSYLYL